VAGRTLPEGALSLTECVAKMKMLFDHRGCCDSSPVLVCSRFENWFELTGSRLCAAARHKCLHTWQQVACDSAQQGCGDLEGPAGKAAGAAEECKASHSEIPGQAAGENYFKGHTAKPNSLLLQQASQCCHCASALQNPILTMCANAKESLSKFRLAAKKHAIPQLQKALASVKAATQKTLSHPQACLCTLLHIFSFMASHF
jgi:hypothetical protein